MTRKRFTAVLLDGHKGTAVEVPFDPATTWRIESVPVFPGRRGHFVSGTLNDAPFESCIVPRMRRFWLLVSNDLRLASGAKIGVRANVSVEPSRAADKRAGRASKSSADGKASGQPGPRPRNSATSSASAGAAGRPHGQVARPRSGKPAGRPSRRT